jgi:hypothetical protein
MKRLISAITCAFCAISLNAATIHVPVDQLTIQAGIDSAHNGDTVLVAPGVYEERINFLGKSILVASNFIFDGDSITISSTVIDADTTFLPDTGSVVFFGNGEDSTSILVGFTLIFGTGTWFIESIWPETLWVAYGGGVLCDGTSPVIANNVITNDWSNYGGGIACREGASPTIIDNVIVSNSSDNGGGMACLNNALPIITGNVIALNSAVSGGGVYCSESSPTIVGNTIESNQAPSGEGGGIHCYLSSPVISDNEITENTAGRGAGIDCWFYSSPTITDNLIELNSATGASHGGGGIRCSKYCAPLIKDNIISRNYTYVSGGGIVCMSWESPTIIGNTIVANEAVSWGGGIHCNYNSSPSIENNTILENICHPNGAQIGCAHDASPTIVNNIIANGPQNAGINGGDISTVVITYNDVFNNAGGNFSGCPEGIGDTSWATNVNGTPCDSFCNIICDPMFCYPDTGNYYLVDTSCCRGAGLEGTDIGAFPVGCGTFICGDINGDWKGPNITDVTYFVDYLFFEGSPPLILGAANVDGDGGVNVADLTYLVDYLFFGGPEPVCGPVE